MKKCTIARHLYDNPARPTAVDSYQQINEAEETPGEPPGLYPPATLDNCIPSWLIGIKNEGASCYLNGVVQMLMASRTIRVTILAHTPTKGDGTLPSELHKIFRCLHDTIDLGRDWTHVEKTVSILSRCKKYEGRRSTVPDRHDQCIPTLSGRTECASGTWLNRAGPTN